MFIPPKVEGPHRVPLRSQILSGLNHMMVVEELQSNPNGLEFCSALTVKQVINVHLLHLLFQMFICRRWVPHLGFVS